MWGIGFSLRTLEKWVENSKSKVESFSCGSLQSCRIYANEIDLSVFDVKQNDSKFWLTVNGQDD